MAEVTPELRAEVEQIAAINDMPLAPLYGALISSDAAELGTDERSARLNEAAAAFVKVREEMKTLASADPDVARLRAEAEEQLALGAFDTAQARLAEAADVDSDSRRKLKANYVERTLSEAATHYISGGAAAADLRYGLAIGDLLQIRLVLAGRDPDNADRQRDISVSRDKIGNVLSDKGDLDGALASCMNGRAIVERLAARDPRDTQLSRDIAVSSDKIGNVRRERGDLESALAVYRDSLSRVSTLAASDPANADWQRDLSIGLEKVADVLRKQGDLAGALDGYERSLPIVRRLVAGDSTNADWQRDLSITLAEIGTLRLHGRDVAGAAEALGESLQIRETLASSEPDNALWQRDLVIAYADYAQVADNPKEVLSRALEITMDLKESGRLPARYEFMISVLKKQLAKVEK